jgi:hypothetical protein
MSKAPSESEGSAPQADEAAPQASPEVPQGEQFDVAGALLAQLEGLVNLPQPGSAADAPADLADDLLPAALHDLAAHNIEQALDQLTASVDLFDLPPLDFGGDGGDFDS